VATTTFNNLIINNSYATPDDVNDVDSDIAVTVSGTLTVTDGQFQPHTGSTFGTVSIGANGILKPDSGNTINITGHWDNTNSGVFNSNNGIVDFNGTTAQNIESGGTGADQDFSTLAVNNTTADVMITTNDVITDMINVGLGATLDFDTNRQMLITVSETISGSVTFDPVSCAIYHNGTTYDYHGGTTGIDKSLLIEDFTSTDNVTIVDGTFPQDELAECNSLTIDSGATYEMNIGNLDSGDITITGTLDATNTIYCSGTWSRTGTYTTGSGTVIFDNTGAGQNIPGETWHNLTINNSSQTATFTGNQIIGNDLVIDGGKLSVGNNSVSITNLLDVKNSSTFNANTSPSITIGNTLDVRTSSTFNADSSIIVCQRELTVYNNNTFNAGSANITISDGGAYDSVIYGILNAQTSTISFSGQDVTLRAVGTGGILDASGGISSISVGNLNIGDSSDEGIVRLWNDGPNALTVSGDLTIQPNSTAILDCEDGSVYSPTIRVAGDFKNLAGTNRFDAGNSTVIMNGTSDQTISRHTTSFYNLTIDATGSRTVYFGEGVFGAKTYTIENNLNWVSGAGVANITMRNNGTAANTLNLDCDLTIPATLTLNADSKINISGSWTNNGGSLIPNSSQVTFDGSAVQLINGTSSTTFYDLISSNTGAQPTSQEANITVENQLTVSVGSIYEIAVMGGADVTLTMGTATTAGTITNNQTFRIMGNAAIAAITGVNASFPAVVSGTDIDWDNGGASSSVEIGNLDYQVNATTGGSGVSISLTGDVEMDTLTVTTGDSFDLNGFNLTLTGSLSVGALSTWTNTTGSLTFNGEVAQSWTDSSAAQDFGDVTISILNTAVTLLSDITCGPLTVTSPATLSQGTNNDLILLGDVILDDGTFTKDAGAGLFKPSANLLLDGGTNDLGSVYVDPTTTLSNDMNATDLTIGDGDSLVTDGYDITLTDLLYIVNNISFGGGTLDATNGTGLDTIITLGGNWTTGAGGTWTSDTSTVIFNGTAGSQIITSNSTIFNNVTINNSGVDVQLADPLGTNGDIVLQNGNLNSSGFDIYCGENWNNTGGSLTHGNATVYFDGQDDHTLQITSNGSPFFDLYFDDGAFGGGSTWTIQDALDANGSVTIDYGTLDSGTSDITVGRDWFNYDYFNANSQTLTFDDNSGGIFSIVPGPDQYNNIIINDQTDSGTTTTWELEESWAISGGLTIVADGGQLDFDASGAPVTIALDDGITFSNGDTVRVLDSTNTVRLETNLTTTPAQFTGKGIIFNGKAMTLADIDYLTDLNIASTVTVEGGTYVESVKINGGSELILAGAADLVIGNKNVGGYAFENLGIFTDNGGTTTFTAPTNSFFADIETGGTGVNNDFNDMIFDQAGNTSCYWALTNNLKANDMNIFDGDFTNSGFTIEGNIVTINSAGVLAVLDNNVTVNANMDVYGTLSVTASSGPAIVVTNDQLDVFDGGSVTMSGTTGAIYAQIQANIGTGTVNTFDGTGTISDFSVLDYDNATSLNIGASSGNGQITINSASGQMYVSDMVLGDGATYSGTLNLHENSSSQPMLSASVGIALWSNGTLDCNGYSPLIELQGSYYSEGSFNAGSSEFKVNGSGAQNIMNNDMPLTFYDFTNANTTDFVSIGDTVAGLTVSNATLLNDNTLTTITAPNGGATYDLGALDTSGVASLAGLVLTDLGSGSGTITIGSSGTDYINLDVSGGDWTLADPLYGIDVSISGGTLNTSTHKLTVNSNFTNDVGSSAFTSTGEVEMTGGGGQINGSKTTFNDLTISGIKTLDTTADVGIEVDGTFTVGFVDIFNVGANEILDLDGTVSFGSGSEFHLGANSIVKVSSSSLDLNQCASTTLTGGILILDATSGGPFNLGLYSTDYLNELTIDDSAGGVEWTLISGVNTENIGLTSGTLNQSAQTIDIAPTIATNGFTADGTFNQSGLFSFSASGTIGGLGGGALSFDDLTIDSSGGSAVLTTDFTSEETITIGDALTIETTDKLDLTEPLTVSGTTTINGSGTLDIIAAVDTSFNGISIPSTGTFKMDGYDGTMTFASSSTFAIGNGDAETAIVTLQGATDAGLIQL